MPFTITEIKSHLTGMGHGGTLNKIRNIDNLFERVGSVMALKLHILELVCTVELESTIHDDIFNYKLPYNFGNLIDLIPDYNRQSWDTAFRDQAGQFDRQKAYRNRTISVEANNGLKFIRINWKSRRPLVLNTMDSTTQNGTWGIVGTASNLKVDTINRKSGAGAIAFDVASSGDGIQNNNMSAVDLSLQNLIADELVWVFLDIDYANLTSITPVWGNDLTTNFWTGVPVTTQEDGTAFRFGWNQIRNPWKTATQTGIVVPSTIDSAKFTFQVTAPMKNIHVDNVVFSIGKNFEMKFYSKYLFQSAATGLWISIPGSDNDLVIVDNDSLPMFLFECLIAMAQQMEGSDGAFDINFAIAQLKELYPAYRGMFPSMVKKVTQSYGNRRPLRGRRWGGTGYLQ